LQLQKQTTTPKKRRSTRPSEEHVRGNLVYIVTGLIALVCIVTMIYPETMPILDKLIPMLTLVLGYYFGYKNNQVPN
jgi:fatty acid desaturase